MSEEDKDKMEVDSNMRCCKRCLENARINKIMEGFFEEKDFFKKIKEFRNNLAHGRKTIEINTEVQNEYINKLLDKLQKNNN